jgi:hypothetical protein
MARTPITLSGKGPVETTQLHIYIRPRDNASTAIPAGATITKTLAETILAEASALEAVESGFTVDTAEGVSKVCTKGRKYILSQVSSGTLNFMFATPEDYDALTVGNNKYSGTICDIIMVKAPVERVVGDVEASGDEVFVIESVIPTVMAGIADGDCMKLKIPFEKTTGASSQPIAWKKVIVTP